MLDSTAGSFIFMPTFIFSYWLKDLHLNKGLFVSFRVMEIQRSMQKKYFIGNGVSKKQSYINVKDGRSYCYMYCERDMYYFLYIQ